MRNNQVESSLNEIDVEIGNILLKEMKIADPRTILPNSKSPLWTSDRIVQVDDLTTEDIFNGYLISNKEKNIDITYPILGYKANDIEEVFYGTGNRINQWSFELPKKSIDYHVNDEICIIRGNYKGYRGIITNIEKDIFSVYIPNIKKFTNLSYLEMRKPSISEDPKTFKAKQIITSYDVAILSQMRKESRYLMDKFILRCTDGQIWHPYTSKIVDNTQFHIFTVFDIPNLNKYSNDESKVKGIGFVYGIAFKVNVWAYLADEPLPEGFIEQIEMNIKLHNDPRINKIMIN